jgi:hypothetical protein
MTVPEVIIAMPDADLVAHVAEKVMGGFLENDAIGLWILRDYCHRTSPERWCPLESWDHCMMVVEAMREKGFLFMLSDLTNDVSFRPHGWTRTNTYEVWGLANPRKAILQAALFAIRSTK